MARWIRLGTCEPAYLHASYVGLAQQLARDAAPVILWGRAHAHLCLGAHQHPAVELVPRPTVPVVRRPLGGGTVWVDEDQICFVFVVPLDHAASRPAKWFQWLLAPVRAVYQAHGLAVEILGDKKIGGSGAGTLGQCAVLAGSFLLRFPAQRFAAQIACPSDGFRAWLLDALAAGMTDWARAGVPPDEAALGGAMRRAVAQILGWTLREDELCDAERMAIEAVLREHADEGEAGARHVPWGIKLRGGMYLTERHWKDAWARVLTRDGRLARVDHVLGVTEAEQVALRERPPTLEHIAAVLAPRLGVAAPGVAAQILDTAYFG